MINRLLRNRELRVKVVPSGKDGFASEEEDILEAPTIDPQEIIQGAKELVTHTAITIFTLAVAYKAFDTICKVIVKKV